MGIEEKKTNKKNLISQLFQMAITKFEEEDKEEMSQGDRKTFNLNWAQALCDFGEFIFVQEFLEESIGKFEALIKENPDHFKALLGSAKAHIVLAAQLHENAVKEYEENHESDDEEEADDDDDDDDEEKDGKQKQKGKENQKSLISDAEKNALAKAFEYHEKGLGLIRDEIDRLSHSLLFAEQLMKYSMVQEGEQKQEFSEKTLSILNQSQDFFTKNVKKDENHSKKNGKDEKTPDDKISELYAFFLLISGYCSISLAQVIQETNQKRAMDLIREGISKFEESAKLNPDKTSEAFEQIGNGYTYLSTLVDDEDTIFDHYNKGLEYLQKALNLDPGNKRLKSILKTLTQE